jgi:cytochrome c-type biogenesis protein CcmH/NrfG
VLEILHRDPNNVDAVVRLTRRLLALQMLNEAAASNEHALKLDPKHPEARVHAAVLQSARGNTEEALRSLNGILQQHPTLAEGWFFRGMLGMMTNKPDLARESWTQYVAVAPDGPRKQRIQSFLDGNGLQGPP